MYLNDNLYICIYTDLDRQSCRFFFATFVFHITLLLSPWYNMYYDHCRLDISLSHSGYLAPTITTDPPRQQYFQWYSGAVVQLLVAWLAAWLACLLAGLLAWFARWLPCLLAGWLACWLSGLLACWLAGLLACWLAGLLACWLAGLLACWLAGLLACLPCLLACLLPCLLAALLPCLLAALLACCLACLLARSIARSLACLLACCLAALLPSHTSLRELSREKKNGEEKKTVKMGYRDLHAFRKHDNSTKLVVNGSKKIYQLWSQPQLGAMSDPLFTRGPMIVFGDPSVWSLNKGVSFRYQVQYCMGA